MNKDINITKVINIISYKDVSESYKWENKDTRKTFHTDLWVNVLVDLLYYGIKTTQLEEKYASYKSNVKGSSNNMYVRSLIQKFQISSKQNSKNIRKKISEKNVTNWVINHIKEIIEKKYNSAVPKGKKIMSDWLKYEKRNNPISDDDTQFIENGKLLVKNAKTRL